MDNVFSNLNDKFTYLKYFFDVNNDDHQIKVKYFDKNLF